MESWGPNTGKSALLSYADQRGLVESFGSWKNISHFMPNLVDIIQKMSSTDTMFVAEMDEYVLDLIKQGVYYFTRDKNGNLLPTIRDAKKIVQMIRLKEVKLPANMAQSLTNLSMQVMMSEILDEIASVGDAIRGLQIELQNDRYALAEGARDKLLQAGNIQDSRLREVAVLNAINGATDAKRILMRNFSLNLQYIASRSQKSKAQFALDFKNEKDAAKKSSDAFEDLVLITNAVQVECEGYAMLGEIEAGKTCLVQFKDFILNNRLNERDTLLLLNEGMEHKQVDLVNGFSDITHRISNFDTAGLFEYNLIELTSGGDKNETE